MEPGAEPRGLLVGAELGRDVPAVHALLGRQPDAQRHDGEQDAAAEVARSVIRRLAPPLLILPAALLARPAALQPPPDATTAAAGTALFAERCSGCHRGGDPRAPSAE